MTLEEVVMRVCEFISQIRHKESLSLVERNVSTLYGGADVSNMHSRGPSSNSAVSVMYQ